jgi:acyl-CoA thioester hydrolase
MDIVRPENDTYKFRLPIQIRFSDLDALNHVNNSYQAQYYDLGRINYFEKVNGGSFGWNEVLVVIVNTENNFFKPILQGEEIYVDTKLVRFGNKSMTMHQRLVTSNGEIKGTCRTILAGFNQKTQTSAEIPQEFKEKFLKFEAVE